MEEMKNKYIILVGKPQGKKGLFGIHKHRQADITTNLREKHNVEVRE
jgi:hypothetical protein